MRLFVGLDVSLAKTAICVISEHGKIMKEAQVASEPEELVRWIGEQEGTIAAIGLEAGPLSQWLHRGLSEAGQRVVLMETRQVKGALRAMPGIGAVVALTHRSAVDDPARFTSSKKVGPWGGLTPSRNQSGERDISGGITKAGDVNLRRAQCQAATVMMHRGRSTWLRTWAAQVARRRGVKRAMVALARRISVILHRMWVDDTDFRSDIAVPHAA
ncbi:transposase [Pararhodobacter sp.]|uniref:transposase n=1 Tax=Pararhodobacter sp. TaxID=2127056 RepID=UPI002AFE2B61|nr:transposase [Pararhodobacter sp.]